MIDFFEIPQVIARRIETANRRALHRLGEDIAKVGSLNNYRDAQLVAIKMTGESVSAITRELSDVSGMTEKDIEKLYADAARYDYEFAEQFYSAKDIEQIPFEKNETLQRTVKALTRAAQADCSNLSHSYAFALRDPDGRVRYTSLAAGYKEAIDKAITAVKLGTTDYKAEMRRILNQYADSGIRTVDWKSGYSQRLDTAVRRNIMDGLRQVKNETQKLIGEEFGADGYEISAHANPAPDHADIQGRQYSFADFEALNDSLERRIGTLNCYHTVTAIILGISSPTYTEEELSELKRRSEELIDIDGKKYTRYECKQLQRKIETETRKLKDRKAALKAAGDDVGVLKANRKIRMLREKYDMITQKAGLDPHYDRMSVPRMAKSIDNSGESSIITKGSIFDNGEYNPQDIKRAIFQNSTNFVTTDPNNPEYYYGEAMKSVKSIPGKYDIVAHGDFDGVKIFDSPVNAKELAKIILLRNDYNGEPIRLLSCNTGKVVNGSCVAQELSDMLDVEVIAPNDYIFTDGKGLIRIGKSRFSDTGEFISFKPK